MPLAATRDEEGVNSLRRPSKALSVKLTALASLRDCLVLAKIFVSSLGFLARITLKRPGAVGL
ncbi:MAG: hypothetical protein LBV23_07955 [Deltaproteobacteria bacterium]|nr:hypothetical protein [Deltaproteobacteria bacterium]